MPPRVGAEVAARAPRALQPRSAPADYGAMQRSATEATTRHIVEEELGDPASYLSVRPGDRVYDLYGWAAGRVVEPRVVATRDEFFDGLVVDFRGRQLFVD